MWCMVPEIWNAKDRIFCYFGPFFVLLPPPSPNNPKNQHSEKMKKTIGDIIILHMHIKNDNHMMYGSWDIKRNKQNFLSFWTIFSPFIPLTTWKIKTLKKWKNAWRYYHFTHVYHKWRSYDVWFLRYKRDGQNFLSFWAIFCPFTP